MTGPPVRVLANWPAVSTRGSYEIGHGAGFPAFDLVAQLRYGAGPRCCRNLRRLTVRWGPARRGRRIGSSRNTRSTRQSDHRQIDFLLTICGGSSKEGLHRMTYSNASASALPTSRTLAAIAKFVF